MIVITNDKEQQPSSFKYDELCPQDVHSSEEKVLRTKTTIPYAGTYYYLIIDGINKVRTMYHVWTEFQGMRILGDLCNIFTKKYTSKMIFAIWHVGFMSEYEVRRLINIGNPSWIRRTLNELQEYHVIDILKENHPEYEIIKEFWRNEYVNSPYKNKGGLPELFTITQYFSEAIAQMSDHILLKYMNKKEIHILLNRRRKYDDFKRGSIMSKEMAEGLVGVCISCGIKIFRSMKKGKDYHDYTAGLVCSRCNKVAPKQQIAKWIYSKK